MFLPQALAGYDSQEDPLRDLASSITLSLCEPHLARGTALTTATLKDIKNAVYTVVYKVSRGTNNELRQKSNQ